MNQPPTVPTHVRADPFMRIVGYIIEIIAWSTIWWSISNTFTIPLWADVISTWPLYVAYKTLLLHHRSATLGHMVTGVRIVDYRSAQRPTLIQAATRSLLEISNELIIPLVFNTAMIALRDDHRHTFDLIASTIAIKAQPDEADVAYQDEHTQNTDDTAPSKDQLPSGIPPVYREGSKPPFA